ncbi:hypothetical protein Sa4125_03160 [Aureimonas sp. SA4125]|uniref:hypothetical protein n=1 Tax=Aureimonas sp. SA4125 TaxID=2826993 RepID=UPI001CC3E570|nr:hypothetical protein [Aureimonas sp. SA4125]BDA82774.1 hypothetical protein Sa4125_03160 [Aureimonas sp. SA4125]
MAGFDDWLTMGEPKLLAETLAAQFRLSQAELQKAQEAMQPAFAIGLQRAMESPAGWSELGKSFMAMAPAGAASGLPRAEPAEAFMQAIFGSEALTGAIARQASMFAGIAPATMQQMMPGLAMLTMEAMMRSTLAGIARSQPQGLATGDYGSATAEMMRRGANAVEAMTQPSDRSAARSAAETWSPAGMATAFGETMKTGLPWMPQPPAPSPEPPRGAAAADAAPQAYNPMLPFAAMFDALSKGMQGVHDAPPPRAPEAAPAAPRPEQAKSASHASRPDDAVPPDNLVDDLLASGQKFQEEYAREMASLFERYKDATEAG